MFLSSKPLKNLNFFCVYPLKSVTSAFFSPPLCGMYFLRSFIFLFDKTKNGLCKTSSIVALSDFEQTIPLRFLLPRQLTTSLGKHIHLGFVEG